MTKIKQAMVLCAGMGSRMGILTQDIPKPMLLVDGVSLIERHLLYLYKNNIHKIVINTFYKAEILKSFINSLSITSKLDIYFTQEDELLGTAGGVKNALSVLGNEPFFVINNDAIFIDDEDDNSALFQLEKSWKRDMMSIIVLLAEKDRSFGYYGKGDFDLNSQKQLSFNKDNGQFIHAGMSIMDYRVFSGYKEKVLQFFPTIYQSLIDESSLYGCVYQGRWLHIGDTKAYETYKL